MFTIIITRFNSLWKVSANAPKWTQKKLHYKGSRACAEAYRDQHHPGAQVVPYQP